MYIFTFVYICIVPSCPVSAAASAAKAAHSTSWFLVAVLTSKGYVSYVSLPLTYTASIA